MISGREAGGQLGPLGERWLWRRNGCSQGGRFVTGILEGRVLDLASVSSFVYDVESERKPNSKIKKMGFVGIGVNSKYPSVWSRKDGVFQVIPW
jgi:hypothetical protein